MSKNYEAGTSTERSKSFRDRQHEDKGLWEVRGIWAPKEDHARIKVYAELVKTKVAIARGEA